MAVSTLCALLILLGLVVASPVASAQEVFEEQYLCAEDVSNVGSCTANEVSLSAPVGAVITDVDGNVLTECIEGQTIKIGTLDAQLDSNTGTRYDIAFWVGKI